MRWLGIRAPALTASDDAPQPRQETIRFPLLLEFCRNAITGLTRLAGLRVLPKAGHCDVRLLFKPLAPGEAGGGQPALNLVTDCENAPNLFQVALNTSRHRPLTAFPTANDVNGRSVHLGDRLGRVASAFARSSEFGSGHH